MNWTWQTFWAMGGHGTFVWGSYAACALLIALEVFSVGRRLRRARARASTVEDTP